MSTVNCRIVLDFERPSKELLEKFKELPVATLDDSMNRMSAMDSGIHAYSKGKLAGPAFTIKVPYGDNLMLHKSVDMIKPGDILVIQCENSLNRAIFGSLLVNNLKEKGARGIIVDGAIRDSEEISQIEGIPVYCGGRTDCKARRYCLCRSGRNCSGSSGVCGRNSCGDKGKRRRRKSCPGSNAGWKI